MGVFCVEEKGAGSALLVMVGRSIDMCDTLLDFKSSSANAVSLSHV